MKPLTLILIFLPFVAWAQTDTLRIRPDTLTDQATRTLDSLQHSFTYTADSIREAYTGKAQTLISLKQKYSGKLDSLKGRGPAAPGNPLDTLHTPDTGVYTKKIDSLDRQLEGLQQKTTAGIDSLKGRVNNHVSKLKLPKGADGKISELTTGMDKVNVPAFNTGVTNKPGLNNTTDMGLPAMPGAGDLTSANLPAINLPSVNATIPGTDIKTPDLKDNIPSTDISTGKPGDITDQARLNDAVGQAADVKKQVQEATGSTEGLGKTLEGKAGEQIKGLPDQKLPEVEGMPGGVPKTGDEAKEQLVDMAKKEAVNHFAGKEAVLTSAMEKMSKYKQKYSSVSSLKDIKDEKHHNEMKGRPLRERLVPALTLQFQSWQDLMLDINPSVGYRLTPHLTAGIGWNQRVAFNIPQARFNHEAKVYGIRTYGEYTFNKGFGFRLDIETMNTPVKQKDPATDVTPARTWVWGALAGIKQKYPIYKKLKGNAQLMYNLFDKDHRSPYLDRVNFRIGLELTLKKNKREGQRP